MPTLKKSERLCSHKIIDSLFTSGKSFTIFPFRVVWKKVELETNFPAQVTLSVSKRVHKKAVTRNYIKRLMREAYRENKEILYQNLRDRNISIAIMIIYIDKNISTLPVTHDKIKVIFERFKNEQKPYTQNNQNQNIPVFE